MQPDNFFYFITLFGISIAAGSYIFFTFNRTWIIIANSFMFFLCAMRASTEYFVQSLDNYADVNQLLIFHSLFSFLLSVLIWHCTYFYIRPLSGSRYEKQFNLLYLLLSTPLFLAYFYGLYHRLFYATSPTKINGYWMFTSISGDWLTFANVVGISFSAFMVFLFVFDIIRTRKRIFFKTLLLLSFIILPFMYIYFSHTELISGKYKIPNAAFIYLTHVSIVSWFCSDYRLFQNNFSNAIKDILNSIADLTVYTDVNSTIKFANNATRQLFSIDKIKLPFIDFLANYTTIGKHELLDQIHSLNKKEQSELELKIAVNGQQHYLMLQSEPFYRANQQIGYLYIMNNVTELRHNQALLERSNQTKDQLFAIIGHDLRKPAIAFRGISRKVNYLLQNNDFKTLQQLGKNWESAANSLNRLIDNLLNWALQQRGILPHQPEIIPLSTAVTDSMDALKNQIADKKIELLLQVPDNIKILADFNSVVTIMRNLLDNAIKYTPENGHIAIDANIAAEHVQISVRDSGIGMNSQQLAELFEIRKGKSRKGTAGESGTGIGLNLVRELVIINNGEVYAESQPNQGTTINIILPNAA